MDSETMSAPDYRQEAATLKRIAGMIKRIAPTVRRLNRIKSPADRCEARMIVSSGLIGIGLIVFELSTQILEEDAKDLKVAKTRADLREAVTRAKHTLGGVQ